MEETLAQPGVAGRPPYPDSERIALSCVDGRQNSRVTKCSIFCSIARLIPAALIVSVSFTITSDRGPTRFDTSFVPQTTTAGSVEDLQTEPSLRAVKTNPYDQVGSNTRQGLEEGPGKNSRIHALFMLSTRRRQNVGTEIQALSERTQASWSALDMEAAKGQFRTEEEVGAVSNQLSETEVWRDWMVPSISMLEEGDTSISPPEILYLYDWVLVRDDLGRPVVGRVGEPLTRVRARTGMTLDEGDRVVAIRDTPDAFYLILENGYRVEGRPDKSVAGGP